MTLQLPGNARMAVAIGADFDAHCLWKGVFDRTSPSYLSRGEFGAEVGVPRLLDLFRRYAVRRHSPAWDFSDATLGLLEEYGFEWDSSLITWAG